MIKVDNRPFVIPGGSRLISSDAADISGAWLHSGRRSLVLYSSKPMKKFAEYLDHFRNKLFATNGEPIYCEWGVYKKTWKGKSQGYDSMNLLHNGWVKNIVRMIPKPSFTGAPVVQQALTLGLIKTRYFLRISPDTGGTTMHGQTFTTTLFALVKDRGNSFTLGAVSKQLQATELYNIVAYGDDMVAWTVLQEMYVKHKFKKIAKNPMELF